MTSPRFTLKLCAACWVGSCSRGAPNTTLLHRRAASPWNIHWAAVHSESIKEKKVGTVVQVRMFRRMHNISVAGVVQTEKEGADKYQAHLGLLPPTGTWRKCLEGLEEGSLLLHQVPRHPTPGQALDDKVSSSAFVASQLAALLGETSAVRAIAHAANTQRQWKPRLVAAGCCGELGVRDVCYLHSPEGGGGIPSDDWGEAIQQELGALLVISGIPVGAGVDSDLEYDSSSDWYCDMPDLEDGSDSDD
ncbi:hypothetical protein CYMTET_56592 [Cymbomonas tetramitiformis]|uniref:Uncharacterized protein n=1 Tax=Cymbomonas tetramitiformis TaxID=36881 RepID=A0AAE0BAL1_9CHLO|nr:hypothetical protein CYMTET_56592 [Cymbomonas tetramitiformis]